MGRITSSTVVLAGILQLTAATGTYLLNIAQNPSAQLQQRSLRARAATVQADLGNAVAAGLYFANVSVGTPAQSLMLQIDTGSSDVWVPSTSAQICQDTRDGGCPGGSFDSSQSSTFNDIEPNGFNISYVDGTGSNGDYFQDTFAIGGATVKNFEMGLALNSTISVGIMGIGYSDSEANTDTGNGTQYPNLPIAMVNAGLIKTNAYSLWLNDLQSNEGSILFGGIDTKKYLGDLISVNVYASSGSKNVTSFTVAFTSLSATSSSGTDQLTPSNYAEAAILDSGTTITLLPDDVAALIFEEVGATVSQQLGATVVPCALAQNSGNITYGFGGVGGPSISVSVSQLVLPLETSNGQVPTYTNGETACQLGIQAAGDLPVLFGDTFLRSAYVVYDLENNRIALAQTNFNSTDSNVVAFASSGAAIPSASTAPNESQVTQTAKGNPKVGVTATATGAAGTATYNPTATGLNAAAGFAVNAKKKNAGSAGPKPFRWSSVLVGGITLGLMGIGGGVFAWL